MNKTKEILKKEVFLSRKASAGIVTGVLLIFCLSFIFCFSLQSATHKIVNNQAVKSIDHISQLNKDSIVRAIENRRLLMEMLSKRIEKTNLYNIEDITNTLEDYQATYEFYNMGILDKNNLIHLANGSVINCSDPNFPKLVRNNSFHIFESRLSQDGKGYMVNTFTHPVYRNGNIEFVLVATYRSGKLAELMNISSLEGKGDTFLLNKQGNVVIYPHHYEDKNYNTLMKYINDNPEKIPDAGGDRYFTYNDERYYAHFEELGINGWHLMTCAKESEVFAEAIAITKLVYLSVAFLWIIIFLTMIIIFHFIHQLKFKRLKENYYDEMLNIPNRNALSAVYKKLPDDILEKMYLVVFDINKFKEFNYIYGSETGDQLLKYIINTIYEAEPDIYLFRYMSDNFIILDTSISNQEYEQKAKSLLDRFNCDIEAGIIPPFGISMGVRKILPDEPLHMVISDALITRDTIKDNQICHYAFYDEVIRNTRLKHMETESEFPKALKNGEFHVYYQPKYNIVSGEIIGAEALARWIRPDGTIISPADFIPCLEANKQITLLDENILKTVCCQMKEMEEEGIDIKPVSVNLSRVHLKHTDILQKIEKIIKESGVNPKNLSFEITESALYEDNIPLQTIIEYIHGLGCRVEMDDYGVGVSGPNSLAYHNFDVVKLDKSFTDGIKNRRVKDIIWSTIYMTKKWDLTIIAEGVEDRAQVKQLMGLGCIYAQGFLFSRPLPIEQYKELLILRNMH